MKYPKIILPLIIFFITFNLMAQEMVTDRPDQTESADVVPLRMLQVETGFLLGGDINGDTTSQWLSYNSTLFRFGLLKNMELRLGFAYLGDKTRISNTDSVYSASGFAPLYTGFKIKIRDEEGWKPSVAFIGALVLPFTAAESFKTRNTGAEMLFAFSNTLTDHLSLGYNIGAIWDGETTVPNYRYSVSLGIGISERTGAFVESYGLVQEDGRAVHLLDAGFTFLVMPNFQLDISSGLGINRSAPDYFASFGLSYRFPR
jgi:hypothetical protein